MTKHSVPDIFIFTALECEAQPLHKHFKLKKENKKHPFSLYQNERIVLVVSGVGKIAMAGAVAYTLALFPNCYLPVMVNIGIAGHKTKALGSLLLAIKIIDKESGKKFYPQLVGKGWPDSAEILTSSLPDTKYTSSYLHEMEASAFYEIAVKFSSSELIHCLKVVSDNAFSSIDNIRPKWVNQLITQELIEIDSLLEKWLNSRELTSPLKAKDYNKIVNEWYFSVSGQIKLNALLTRWCALSTQSWLESNNAQFINGKALLQKLEKDVDKLDVYL